MSSLLVTNCRLYDVPDEAPLRSILVRNGSIERIADTADAIPADQVLDAGGRIVAPGFIDVAYPGGRRRRHSGRDAGGAPDDLADLRPFRRDGLPGHDGLQTRAEEPPFEVAAEYTGRDLGGAQLLGTHLEGPFISPHKRGMIQPDCLGEASSAILADIYTLLGDTLKMMTVAPELPGSARDRPNADGQRDGRLVRALQGHLRRGAAGFRHGDRRT